MTTEIMTAVPSPEQIQQMGIDLNLTKTDLFEMVEETIEDSLARFIIDRVELVLEMSKDADLEVISSAIKKLKDDPATAGMLTWIGEFHVPVRVTTLHRKFVNADDLRDWLDDTKNPQTGDLVHHKTRTKMLRVSPDDVGTLRGDWGTIWDTKVAPGVRDVNVLPWDAKGRAVSAKVWVNEGGFQVMQCPQSINVNLSHGASGIIVLPTPRSLVNNNNGVIFGKNPALDAAHEEHAAVLARALRQYKKVARHSKRARSRMLREVLGASGDERSETLQYLVRSLAQKPIQLLEAVEAAGGDDA